MKKYYLFATAVLLLSIAEPIQTMAQQGVSINTTGDAADASAMLDVTATDKGMLVPRMTDADKTAIVSPATGLLIFQTDGTPGFYYYNGTSWQSVSGGGGGWAMEGNAGTDPATHFIGTTDGLQLRFRVNNEWAGELGYAMTAYGVGALQNNNGIGNTAVGWNSLLSNTSGNFNTAIGEGSLSQNTTGRANTASGNGSLASNESGSNNTAAGLQSLALNTAGVNNTASGASSLLENTTGNNNTAIGASSLLFNSTGSDNTAMGYKSLQANTTSGNTGYGSQSLAANTTGANNTAIGYQSLTANVTGSYNLAIGYGADVTADNLENSIVIGYNAKGNGSNEIVLGNADIIAVRSNGVFTTLSDGRFKTQVKENVPGLDFILKLRPVTYHFQAGKFADFQGRKTAATQKQQETNAATEKQVRTGFIAQEVEQAAKETGYDFSGVHKPQNEKDNYSLSYADFTVPLVKAVQELNSRVKELEAENALLKAETKKYADLSKRMEAIEASIQGKDKVAVKGEQ